VNPLHKPYTLFDNSHVTNIRIGLDIDDTQGKEIKIKASENITYSLKPSGRSGNYLMIWAYICFMSCVGVKRYMFYTYIKLSSCDILSTSKM
jgi:hypothetical protein